MQKYTKIAYHSRGLDPHFQKYMPCEFCEYKYKHPKLYENSPRTRKNIRRANDIHHIEGRGGGPDRNFENRMYDPQNLIFLCRTCHNESAPHGDIMKSIVLSHLIHPTYEDCIATDQTIEH